MLNNFASTQQGGEGTVTTTTILDSTIVNADVDDDAAIELSKLSQASEQKLGIGTEPTETLHVRDGRTTGGSAGLLIQKFEAVDGTSYGAFVEATGGSTKNIGLYVQAEGGTTNYGLLVPNGSVGIGTTSPKTDLTVEGTVTLKEQAAADGDTAAYGQLWVKSDTPNTLYFTDDAGTDTKVTTDTNTTYSAGDGLDISGTTFSTDLKSNGGLEIQSTELSVAQGISQYDVAQFAASVADNDFLKIDSTSVEGRSAAEVLSDIAALPLAGGTMSGAIAAADQVIGRPIFTDYAETINAIGATGGGTQDIDVQLGNVVSATVDTSANTFTFSDPSATGKSCSFTLFLTNGGSQDVNWPGAVDWAGGSAPSLTSSGVDVLTFTTLDAGTIWYGFAAGLDMG